MSPEQLEKHIERMLRKQPLRRAPASLQAAVWARLNTTGLPWWQRSFTHWPLTARAALVALCLLVATGGLQHWQATGIAGDIEPWLLLQGSVNWFERLSQWVQTAFEFLSLLMRHAPASWWYAGALLLAVAYATLATLGAAGYRVLYADNSSH